jgi:hypothetical protein
MRGALRGFEEFPEGVEREMVRALRLAANGEKAGRRSIWCTRGSNI